MDESLYALFQGEASAHLDTLALGVEQLRSGRVPSAAELGELSRAAHSIKGAGRIIDVDAAVKLAGALERRFDLGEPERSTGAAAIPLVAAVELLLSLVACDVSGIDAWSATHATAIGKVVAEIEATAPAGPPAKPAARRRTAAPGPPARTPPAAATPPTPPAPAPASPAIALPPPPAHPPPAPLAAPPSRAPAWADDSLIELFKAEVETNCSALTAGLLELEQGATDAGLATLMRAAHSIKGAAQIVGIDVAVTVAHAMEDAFVAAQEGRVTLGSEAVDSLLRAVDMVSTIAHAPALDAWRAEHGGAAAQLAGRLSTIVAAGTSQGPAAAPAERPAAPPPSLASSAAAVVVRDAPPPSRAAPGAAVAGAPAPSSSSTATSGGADRVVRVAVENINQLMNLAGESLVGARTLGPLVASLHKLGQKQTQLADVLGEIGLELRGAGADERIAMLVATARARALECRETTMQRTTDLDVYARRAEDLTERLYRAAITSRMRPFSDGLHGLPRMVRDLGRKLDKQVELKVLGESVGVDRDILDKLEAPINHLLRNAMDHGLESPAERALAGKPARGELKLEARHWAGMLSVTVSDDGRGIDPERVRSRIVRRGLADAAVAEGFSEPELLEYLFVPGFSTRDNVTEVSGRGVGLDVVRSVVEEVGGSVRLSSQLGAGTSFHLQLPITLSVVRSVLVEIAGEPYAFPMNRIERIVAIPRAEVRTLENRQYFMHEERSVGLVSGHELLELPRSDLVKDLVSIVVLSDRTHLCGVAVDRFLGEHDLVIRALDPRLGKVPDISASALLTDGSPVLVVDVEDMARSIVRLLQGGELNGVARAPAAAARLRILVVDDSITVREVQRQLLANSGYEVTVAVDGLDGWNTLRDKDFDLVITDVDMPRMNGLELVRSIKQDTRLRSTPVMIVSYRDQVEDRQRGLEAGANYYFTKSDFHDAALLQAVGELIGEPT